MIRLAQIHDTRKQGLVTYAIQVARDEDCLPTLGPRHALEPAEKGNDVAAMS